MIQLTLERVHFYLIRSFSHHEQRVKSKTCIQRRRVRAGGATGFLRGVDGAVFAFVVRLARRFHSSWRARARSCAAVSTTTTESQHSSRGGLVEDKDEEEEEEGLTTVSVGGVIRARGVVGASTVLEGSVSTGTEEGTVSGASDCVGGVSGVSTLSGAPFSGAGTVGSGVLAKNVPIDMSRDSSAGGSAAGVVGSGSLVCNGSLGDGTATSSIEKERPADVDKR